MGICTSTRSSWECRYIVQVRCLPSFSLFVGTRQATTAIPSAIATLAIGNLGALVQTDLKRLLAFVFVLFALLGTFLIYAAFKPSLQTIAILGGLVSTTAFFWLVLSGAGYNSSMTRVLYADVIAIVCLLAAATSTRKRHET